MAQAPGEKFARVGMAGGGECLEPEGFGAKLFGWAIRGRRTCLSDFSILTRSYDRFGTLSQLVQGDQFLG